jgi:hypothetical protein
MAAPSIAYVAPATSLAILAALIVGLQAGLNRGAFGREERSACLRNGAAILFTWFLSAFALSRFEFFRGAPERIPTVEIGILTPILIGGWLLWRSRTLNRLMDAIPQPWLIGVQLYRAFGIIFLILLAQGKLPGQFAWPAGVGDIMVGVTAPFVALAFARGAQNRERLAYVWNIFGLFDLMVAVSMGLLTSPSPFQMAALSAPNMLISAFPLVMVPVFAVPASVLLHIVSLMKLVREREPAPARA